MDAKIKGFIQKAVSQNRKYVSQFGTIDDYAPETD